MLSGLVWLVRLSVELAEAEVAMRDQRAHAHLGRERDCVPVRVSGLFGLGGHVGVDIAEHLQGPGFPASFPVGPRLCHGLLHLLSCLGDPSENEIGLGQERDRQRTESQNPHRRERFDRFLQQRHCVGRAARPEIGGAQARRDERQGRRIPIVRQSARPDSSTRAAAAKSP